MQTRKAILLAAGVLVATPNIFAEKVEFKAVPRHIQDAIRSRSGRAPIEDIDKTTRDGRVVYEAAFKLGGAHQELVVGEDGKIVKDIASRTAGMSGSAVTLANRSKIGLIEAPLAVQKALQNQMLGSAQITGLHKGEWNKQTIYEASFDKNGQRQIFQVTESGQPVVATAAVAGPRYAGLSDANVQLAGGAKMNFTDAPKPVQNTINQLSNGARVEDFEKGQWNGRVVYEAGFKKDGKHMELQVLEDGSLLTKQPGASATASTPAPSRVPLAGGAKVDFNSAPQPVQTAINQAANGARIEDFEKGQWNGRVVYEAAFKKNGQHTEVQVFEDGSLVANHPQAAGAAASAQTGSSQQ